MELQLLWMTEEGPVFFHQALPLSVSGPLDTLQSRRLSTGHLILAADGAHTCGSVGRFPPEFLGASRVTKVKPVSETVLHRKTYGGGMGRYK